MECQRNWAEQPLITELEDNQSDWEVRSQSTVFAQHTSDNLIPFGDSDLPTPHPQPSRPRDQAFYFIKLIAGSLVIFSFLGILGYLIILLGHQFIEISVSSENSFSLLYGSLVSFGSCLLVITDFRMNVPSRRHPAPIIYWRTVADFCCSAIFIVANTRGLFGDPNLDCRAGSGRVLAATVEFLFLSSEGWFCVLIADLVTSLTNPFADYRANMLGYHYGVWTLGILAFIGMLSTDCSGGVTKGMCWLKNLKSEHWTVNECLWGFYVGWVVIFYGYGVLRLVHAKLRLIGKGTGAIEETRAARRLVVDATLSALALYMAYLALCGTAAVVLSPFKVMNHKHTNDTKAKWSSHAIAYVFAARGFVDLAVWFSFKHDGLSRSGHKENPADASFCSDLSNLTLEELDLDLSPQLNPVLRSEIVSNVTTGIRMSVEQHLSAVREAHHSHASFNTASLWAEEVNLTLPSGVRFQDHRPASFALIRKACGLGDLEYVTQVERITAEKLSEGKSGAFMFFSKNGRFIIKTLEAHEAHTLHGMLQRYATYLNTHKGSLLSRYLGSHTLHMYGQVFHFIVMFNVFRDAQTINARYDIKGSWVNRSATPATPGARARCRHCRAPYIIGKSDPCRGRLEHEPDVVLKDNDFKTKVTLRPEQAISLISRLEDDSNFLCSEGIMDYSLLIGVQHINFSVNPQATLKKQAVRRRESLRQSYVSQVSRSASNPRFQRQESGSSHHRGLNKRGSNTMSSSAATSYQAQAPNHSTSHQRRRSSHSPNFEKLDTILSPIPQPQQELPPTPELTHVLDRDSSSSIPSSPQNQAEDEVVSSCPSHLTESSHQVDHHHKPSESSSGLPDIIPPSKTTQENVNEEEEKQLVIMRDDVLKVGPLSRANVLKLTRGNSTMLRESGWDNTWDFDESASEVTSDASGRIDLLPGTVTDFDPDYTGFMQPDPILTAPTASESRVSEGDFQSEHGRELSDDPFNLIMDEDESNQLIAQLRDPTSSIFQTRVVVGPGLFYVGIVDTLETWSLKKRMEYIWKSFFLTRPEDQQGLSCIPPEPYSTRFKLRIRDIVEHDFIRQLPSS